MQILREEGYDKHGGKEVGGKGGVVHSFTGTPEEAKELVCPLRVVFRQTAERITTDGHGLPHQVTTILYLLDRWVEVDMEPS